MIICMSTDLFVHLISYLCLYMYLCVCIRYLHIWHIISFKTKYLPVCPSAHQAHQLFKSCHIVTWGQDPVGAKPTQQSCSWRVTAASCARASRGDREGEPSLELGVGTSSRDWLTSCMAVSSNLNCSRSTRAWSRSKIACSRRPSAGLAMELATDGRTLLAPWGVPCDSQNLTASKFHSCSVASCSSSCFTFASLKALSRWDSTSSERSLAISALSSLSWSDSVPWDPGRPVRRFAQNTQPSKHALNKATPNSSTISSERHFSKPAAMDHGQNPRRFALSPRGRHVNCCACSLVSEAWDCTCFCWHGCTVSCSVGTHAIPWDIVGL